MVICFAARNQGKELMRRALDEGYIVAEAAAKNCITVGASRSSRDPIDPNLDVVANFSNRGPVKNRRHKPDVVASGTCIFSANSGMVQTPANLGPDNHWCYKEGTLECWWCGPGEKSIEHLYTKCRRWKRQRRKLVRSLSAKNISWQGWIEKKEADKRALGPLLKSN